MLKLYYAPRTRGTRPRWLLEELEVPYELVRITLKSPATQSPEYLKIHPLGQVPALTDGEHAIFESGAICAYLADKFPEKGFAPPTDSPLRADYYQWLFYSAATLEPPAMNVFYHTVLLPEERRIPRLVEEGREGVARCASVLEKVLADRQYLLGDRVTTPDIVIGSLLIFAERQKLLNDFPAISHYCNRLSERPAFVRANRD